MLFVVWANFIAGLIYLISAYGLLKKRKWTVRALIIAALILVAAFIGLRIHINAGGIYETKTVHAMIFRTSVTILFAFASWFLIRKNEDERAKIKDSE